MQTICCRECHRVLPLESFWVSRGHRFDRATICKECGRKDTNRILHNLISGSRTRARAKGLPHEIDRKFLLLLLEKQKGKCALTGLEMTLEVDERYVGSRRCPPNRVSVDRIDNRYGYTRDNVQLVCDAVNRIRGFAMVDNFIEFCVAVADTARPERRR